MAPCPVTPTGRTGASRPTSRITTRWGSDACCATSGSRHGRGPVAPHVDPACDQDACHCHRPGHGRPGQPLVGGVRGDRGAAGARVDGVRRGLHAAERLGGQREVLVLGAAPGVDDVAGALLEVQVGRADRHGVRAGEHYVGRDGADVDRGGGLFRILEVLEDRLAACSDIHGRCGTDVTHRQPRLACVDFRDVVDESRQLGLAVGGEVGGDGGVRPSGNLDRLLDGRGAVGALAGCEDLDVVGAGVEGLRGGHGARLEVAEQLVSVGVDIDDKPGNAMEDGHHGLVVLPGGGGRHGGRGDTEGQSARACRGGEGEGGPGVHKDHPFGEVSTGCGGSSLFRARAPAWRHDAGLYAAVSSTRPCSIAWRSRCRPRRAWLLTVPRGIPVRSAIWAWLRSS